MMERLQHYVELSYIVGTILWLFEAYNVFRLEMWREMKKRDYLRALGLLLISPLVILMLIYSQ